MKNCLFVGTGGFLGAVLRYFIESLHLKESNGSIPINTLLVNISGCFILALFLTLVSEIWTVNEHTRLGIATGFVGAYTTFSTLCKEVSLLLSQGWYDTAVLYVALSIGLGLAATYLGFLTAKAVPLNPIKGKG